MAKRVQSISIVEYGISAGGVLFSKDEVSMMSLNSRREIRFFNVLHFNDEDFVVVGSILIKITDLEDDEIIKILREEEEAINKALHRHEEGLLRELREREDENRRVIAPNV